MKPWRERWVASYAAAAKAGGTLAPRSSAWT